MAAALTTITAVLIVFPAMDYLQGKPVNIESMYYASGGAALCAFVASWQ